MSHHSLIFGVDNYERDDRIPNLSFTTRDAKRLGAVMASPDYGGNPDTVVVSTNASHDQARRKLFDFLNNLGQDDQAFIHFSGHGMLDDGGRLYLCFADTTHERLIIDSLSADQIGLMLSNSDVGKAVVSLDCCFAAAGGNDMVPRAAQPGQIKKAGDKLTRATGVAFLAAAGETQTAKECSQLQAGVFTHHLIEAITSAEADVDDSGEITVDELKRYLSDKVPKHASQQRPHASVSGEVGDMVVAVSRQIQMRQLADLVRTRLRESYASNALDLSLAHEVEHFISGSDLRPLYDTPKWNLISKMNGNELSIAEFSSLWRNIVKAERTKAHSMAERAARDQAAQRKQEEKAELERRMQDETLTREWIKEQMAVATVYKAHQAKRLRGERTIRGLKACAVVVIAVISGGVMGQYAW